MAAFLYILGLLLGIAAFLYLLSIYDTSKKKYKEVTGRAKKNSAEKITSKSESKKTNFPALINITPGERMCPLCRTSLTKYQPLYASNIETESGKRILIHGCDYCYKINGKKG